MDKGDQVIAAVLDGVGQVLGGALMHIQSPFTRHAHRARQFGVGDLARFDLVLAMDASNLEALQRTAAAAGSSTPIELLRAYDPSAPPGAEVPDPYYGGPDGFVDAFDMAQRACNGLLDHLVATGRLPGAAPPA